MENSNAVKWVAGQRVALGRKSIVTIDRVTASGRAVVGMNTYMPDGHQRGGSAYYTQRLEVLTTEIEVRMALDERARAARQGVAKAVDMANDFLQKSFSGWGSYKEPDPDDVAKAEQLAAAIIKVLDGVAA